MGRGAVGCLKLCLGLGQFEAASKEQLVFFSQGRRVFCLPEQELWSNIAQLGLVRRLAGEAQTRARDATLGQGITKLDGLSGG